MREWETLRLEQADSIATVTLNRPAALNAISAMMRHELGETFQMLAGDPAIRAILLTGAGDRAFAAGADIRELQQTDSESGKALSEHGQRVFSQIECCGKPVIACLNGVAFGGGLELALACTLRLASENAQMGLPEAKLGLIPGFGGIHRLVRLIGSSSALRLMLTAHPVQAEEALRLGLIDEVLAPAELLPRAQEMARTIAGLAPRAIQSLLSLVRREQGMPPADAFGLEAALFGELCGSADKHEGLTAFLEKRRPVWREG